MVKPQLIIADKKEIKITVVGKLTTKHREAKTEHRYYVAFRSVDYQLKWFRNENWNKRLQEELQFLQTGSCTYIQLVGFKKKIQSKWCS